MFRFFLSLMLGCALASGAAATPVTNIQEGYTPSSRTSQAITGPIIISRDKIVFGTGDVVDLRVVSEGQRGAWGDIGEIKVAQIFEMQSDPGGLVDDIPLCGSGKPVRYLTVYQDQVFGAWVLSLAFFSGDTPPTQVDNPDLCGTFGYEMIRPVPEGL